MYPTEEQLDYIKNFNVTERPVRELIDYIEPIWMYGDWGFKVTAHKLELHTGGWSGNEDIIHALQMNFLFWSLCWQKSVRGGHYYFNDKSIIKKFRGFTE